MKRRRLIFAAALVIAALIMLFGCGACCLFSPHRCSAHPHGIEPQPPHSPFTANGITHQVYTFGGGGPDVILLHELPGLTLDTVALAKKLSGEEHYTVHVPLMFGEFADKGANSAGFKKCFNELNCLGNGDSAFSGWLRELIAKRLAGRQVMVVGMCMTGSAALEVADAPGVVAVVMAQPSLPLPLTRWQRPKIGVTADHAQCIKKAGTPILAMRFSEDCMATRERFRTLRATFPATQIEFEEVDSRPGNTAKFCQEAHATLTGDYSEQAYQHLRRFLAANSTKPAPGAVRP